MTNPFSKVDVLVELHVPVYDELYVRWHSCRGDDHLLAGVGVIQDPPHLGIEDVDQQLVCLIKHQKLQFFRSEREEQGCYCSDSEYVILM